MNTEKLPRLAHVGGATNGQLYGLEIVAGGDRLEVGLNDGDMGKLFEMLFGLTQDAANIAPTGTQGIALSQPQAVTNLALLAGRSPGEIILAVQSGKLTIPFALHANTLIKLFAALQQAQQAERAQAAQAEPGAQTAQG